MSRTVLPCDNGCGDKLYTDADRAPEVWTCGACWLKLNKAAGDSTAAAPSPLDVQVGGDHYKQMAIQPAEFIAKNGLGFLEGCVIKRMCRWKRKNGIEDLRKAKHEIDLLIEFNIEENAK